MKKTFRLITLCLLTLLVGTTFQSCKDDEYHSRLKELLPLKYPSPFSYEGGKQTTTYRNEDLSNYVGISDVSWCHVDIDVQASEITVSVDENDTYSDRTANILLADSKDASVTRTFTVSQQQNPAVLISTEPYEAKSDGETVQIEVQHNVEYTVECSASWITVSNASTRALTTSKILIEVARNLSGAPRQAVVTVTSVDDDELYDQYVIKQSFNPDFKVVFSGTAVYDSTYVVDEKGGDISIVVQSNYGSPYYELYMDPDASWVTRNGSAKDLTEIQKIQTLSVTEFTKKTEYRQAELYFSPPGGSTSNQVKVKIKQIRNLYLEESALTIMAGNSSAFTLYNPNSVAVTWTTSDEKVATVDATGKVTGVSEGSAIIKVTSADGKYSDAASITVTRPLDLRDQLSYEWKSGYSIIDGIEVLTSLTATLKNNSNYPIQLSRVTLYCDGAALQVVKYNTTDQTGQVSAGGSHVEIFDIEVEREPDSDDSTDTPAADKDSDTTGGDDSTVGDDTTVNEDTIGGDDTTEGTEGKARRSTTATGAVAGGKALPNTHSYKVSWDYSYNGESFSYTTDKAYSDAYQARSRKSSARTSTRSSSR